MEFWRRYWFAPAPCLDLAVVRIIAAAVQLFWVLIYAAQHGALVQRAALHDEYWAPLVVLNVFHLPWGWGFRPEIELLQVVYIVSIAAGVLSLIGLLTNLSLLVFAAASVYLQAFLYSFGDFHHPEAVMMIALGVLALSPSGRALSVDAWLRRRKSGAGEPADAPESLSEFAGWPLKLLQWFFVLMYMSAVWSKLTASGLDWANGYTLQYILARDGLRWGSPLAVWLSQHHLLILVAQFGVLLFQATFALAVIFPKLRWLYVPAGLAMHVGIFVTMQAPFFTWIGLYAVFIPWSRALRLVRDRGLARSPLHGDAGKRPVGAILQRARRL